MFVLVFCIIPQRGEKVYLSSGMDKGKERLRYMRFVWRAFFFAVFTSYPMRFKNSVIFLAATGMILPSVISISLFALSIRLTFLRLMTKDLWQQ